MPAVNGTELPSNITDAEPGAKPAAKSKKGSKNSVENVYQKKTQLEHILLRPDTYIGSVEYVKETMWIYNAEQEKILQKEIEYVPGLYKIYDEILVNAADNKQRDPGMDTIKIDIDAAANQITIFNNGHGIPVAMHKEQKMYVPTMIFGHLLTSSNYNDEEQKVTGGRNGYGAKLCNIFSTKFSVETASEEYGKVFKQTWGSNMSKASEPKIRDFHGSDFTRITFNPDLTKFKMESLDVDIVGLLSRRAFDIAASTRGVKVFLNGKKIPVKNFKEYVDLYLKDKVDDADNPVKAVYENCNPRWEVAVAISDKGFQQMSFVNSIATTKGGRHVDHATDLVVKSITENIKKKNKSGMQIKPFQIKNHMWIFVNCLIVNPTFDSQTKENMTLQVKNFGSKCTLTDKFTSAVMKGGIVEAVMAWAKFKQQAQLQSKCANKRLNKIKGIPKLEDANDAGTRNSQECTLILTEGDSAKTLAVAGLGVVGRDRYGVFPLKGKLLNVREASHKQILENAEINNIIKILGLQYKKSYNTTEDMKTLRYGKLMIMTDQDQDGSHIKGLLINFIHHNWPTLLHRDFMEEFITPIVKASKKKEEISFYSLPEFEEWKKAKDNWHTYKIKYYKGLGTSTSVEAKEYFSDMLRHRIIFNYNGNQDDHSIKMAFSKKAIDQRKEWLTGWMEECKRRKELGLPDVYLYEKNTRAISYADFVNKELVLFSNLDNERSIPSLVDGFKPGQRKVMYTCLKRNDKREVKVAQLAGSIAEHSAYHHGEASLMGTIINLAQNFVGSNNINILQPIGQFGTRLQGGKDSASPRYIFTMLSKLAKKIFHPHDTPLLKSNYDDNQRIEPEWYIPIIPMILVNGADGIGTGWSTKISNYNPREIISNLKKMIKGEEPTKMKPWFKNFRGTIEELDHQRYVVNGEMAELGENKIEITELPVRVWTQTYKEGVMEAFMAGTDKAPPIIQDYKEYHTDTTVRFVVSMTDDKFQKARADGFHKTFKLQASLSTSCMVLFDANGVLRKFETVEEILKEFFELRLKFYVKRKAYLVGLLEAEATRLSNQARFILEKCDGRLVVENKKRDEMCAELQRKGYDPDPLKAWKKLQDRDAALEEEQTTLGGNVKEEDDEVIEKNSVYDYLLGMKMWSLTKENKDKLLEQRDDKTQELKLLKEKTVEALWEDDLDDLLEDLDVLEKEEIKIEAAAGSAKPGVKKEKGQLKKNMNAAASTKPANYGDRIVPFIDAELRKKAAAATKGKRANVLKKETAVLEGDEFDDIVAGNTGKSLASRLGNSPDAIIKKARAKKGEGAKAKAAAAAGDGMRQTKIPFKKASPKKRKGKEEWETDSEEDDTLDSDIDESPRKESTRTTSRRTAASKVKFSFGDDDDEDAGISDDEEEVLMDNDGIEEPGMPTSQSLLEETIDDQSEDVVISDTDSEFEAKPAPKPKAAPKPRAAPKSAAASKPTAAPKPAAAPKPVQSSPPAPEKPSASELFDSMIFGGSPGSPTAEPMAASQPQKRAKSFDSSDEDDEPQPKKPAPKAKAAAIVSLDSDDDELPPILKKKSAPKAAAKPGPKKKAKKMDSDSDSDYGAKKPKKKAGRPKGSAKKKTIVASDSDDKADSDSDFEF